MSTKVTILLLALLSVGGCEQQSTVQTAPASTELPPLEGRRAMVGDIFVSLNHRGNRRSDTITAVDEQYVSGENTAGCSWKVRRNAYAPDVEWSNCGNSGTQTSRRIGSSIFPMTVGSTETWDYSGTNDQGGNWESTRECKVVGSAQVSVPAGTFDTYHVRCEDGTWVREWYTRSDGVSVKFSRTRKVGSQDGNSSWKLVSFTPAS